MNIGGIILSVIAYIIIGMLWYSPFLFGNIWMKVTGVKPEKIDKEKMNFIYGISAFSSLVTAIVLNYLQQAYDLESIAEALFLGFILWLGFNLTSLLVTNLYEGRSVKITIINTGYQLVTILVMSLILYLI